MHFPVLLTGCRRFGQWLAYEWFQLALWLAFGLRFITSVRSAFHSGSDTRATAGPAVRPRRFRRSTGPLKSAAF